MTAKTSLTVLAAVALALAACTERRTAAPPVADGDTIEVTIDSRKADEADGAVKVMVTGPTARPMEEGVEPLDPFQEP